MVNTTTILSLVFGILSAGCFIIIRQSSCKKDRNSLGSEMVILHSMVKIIYYLEYGGFDQRLQKFSGGIEKIGVFRRYHIFLILPASAVCQYAFGSSWFWYERGGVYTDYSRNYFTFTENFVRVQQL